MSALSRQILPSRTVKDSMVVSITPPAWRILFMWYVLLTDVWTKYDAEPRNETLEHRGRKGDPLYRIRKLMLKGVERP